MWIAGFSYAILVAEKIQQIVKNNFIRDKAEEQKKAQELNKEAMK